MNAKIRQHILRIRQLRIDKEHIEVMIARERQRLQHLLKSLDIRDDARLVSVKATRVKAHNRKAHSYVRVSR